MKKVIVLFVILAIGYLVYNKYSYLSRSFRNFPNPSVVTDSKPVFYSPTLSDPDLKDIKLQDGYSISYFAKNVPGARSMTLGNKTVYVGTRESGAVYALDDIDGDGQAEARYVVAKDLKSPNGVAYKDGDLYVAESDRIIRFKDIEINYKNSPLYEVVYDKLPKQKEHDWKYIAFGPDELLYIAIGMPCNVCRDQDMYGRIIRINPSEINAGFEVFATGIRNTVGFDWDPTDNSMWFTDNGRDWLGDNSPDDELNHADRKDLNFGFPYCHAGEILDPKYGKDKNCSDYEKPVAKLGAHVAALGMKFVGDKIYIAEHGSWNRSEPQGYRVVTADKKGNIKVFVEGWLKPNGDVTGRPVDILPYQDGMLISDDLAGVIYLIR